MADVEKIASYCESLQAMLNVVKSEQRRFTEPELEMFLSHLDRACSAAEGLPEKHYWRMRLEEIVESLKIPVRKAVKMDLNSPVSNRESFRSFGEQLQMIARAGRGGEVDPRLYQTRAATGLSEGVPSDGGYLIAPTYSQDIFRAAFNVGQIAKLCREVPIGTASNSVKINAVDESSRVSSRWGGIVGQDVASHNGDVMVNTLQIQGSLNYATA